MSAFSANLAGSVRSLDVDTLTDDPHSLKQLLRAAQQELAEKDARIGELVHVVKQLQRWRFGRRSERVPVEQLLFAFVQAFAAAPKSSDPEPPAATAAKKKTARPHGRRVVPADLPTVKEVIDLPEAEKRCRKCKHELIEIGQESSKQLDIQPPELRVKETIRPKYACGNCEGHGVAIADMPVQPIPRCLAAPGLLAWTVVQKYQFHLPLNRQSQFFKSLGIDLPPSTLCGWIAQTADLVKPVQEAMKKDVLKSEVMNTDDSPVPVLDPELDRTRESRLYAYVGDARHRHVVYDYAPNHRHRYPQNFLAGYSKYLQADAWKGYDKLFLTGSMIEVGCMAHCRRYYFESLETDSTRARTALAFIHQLYDIEDQARDLSPEDRRVLRQAHALPILGAFKAWIQQEALSVIPRTPIAKALTYSQNQWQALTRYVEDGRLSIDNNGVERLLRGPVVGKGNWMFFGSDEGGIRAAILYSLVQSAKLNGHDPFAYLRDVISRVATHSVKKVLELTPAYWKPRDGPRSDTS
jgi:transposase